VHGKAKKNFLKKINVIGCILKNLSIFDMLRPIPQDEIDLVVQGPVFPQNTGY